MQLERGKTGRNKEAERNDKKEGVTEKKAKDDYDDLGLETLTRARERKKQKRRIEETHEMKKKGKR